MEKNRYHALDIMKYICAILVIAVHTSPLKPYSVFGNFIIINIFGRFAVPFFFVCAGYFTHLNVLRRGDIYFKHYIISLIKLYLIWSLIYLPFGMNWVQSNLDIPSYLLPVAFIVGLFYIGTYFHLWYVPALIFSLLVVHWFTKRYQSYRIILISGFLLLCVGAMETYYGYLSSGIIKDAFDQYINVFFTTRNGLFYGLFYVACGYYLVESVRLRKIGHYGFFTILFFGLMTIEAFLLYGSDSIDFNFLIMAAPFTVYLFLYMKSLHCDWKLPYHKLQAYSSYYYFTHAMFLVLIPLILQPFHYAWLFELGWFRFFTVLPCTHLLSACLYRIAMRKKVRS